MRHALIIIAALAVGCEDRGVLPTTRPAAPVASSLPAMRQTRSDLTLDDFQNLRADMTLEQLYAQVGQPGRDVGSGIHILEYVLSDRSSVYVGSSGRNILYVRHGSLRGGKDLLQPGG